MAKKKLRKVPTQKPLNVSERACPLFQNGAMAVIEMSLVGVGDFLLQTLTLTEALAGPMVLLSSSAEPWTGATAPTKAKLARPRTCCNRAYWRAQARSPAQ